MSVGTTETELEKEILLQLLALKSLVDFCRDSYEHTGYSTVRTCDLYIFCFFLMSILCLHIQMPNLQ